MLTSLLSVLNKGRKKDLQLEIGKTYATREGETVAITDHIEWYERHALLGYQFKDTEGNIYLPNGKFMRDREDRRDLVMVAG